MSIRWKLVMMYIALVFLVMLISGTFIIFSLQLQEETRAEHDLAQTARHIEDTVIRNSFRVPEFFIEDGQEAFEELFSQNFDLVGFPLSVQAFIISGEDWRTIVSTEDDLVGEYDFFTTSVVVAAKAGQSNFSAGRDYISSIEGRIPWFEYAMPVFLEEFRENNQRIDNIPDYIIYVRERADDFNDRLLSTTLAIGFSSLIALFGASVLGLLFSNSITKHILILNRQVKDFAGGMLTGRLEVPSNDEIGQLTESFNNMASALELTITQTTNEKNKTEIILYNMTDGVLAYDNNGALIHSNYIVEELLGIENISGMSMNEMLQCIGVSVPVINEDTEESKETEKTKNNTEKIEDLADTSVSIRDKYINASFNPYKNNDGRIEGVIIVFQDITKHMKLENMRKEFVANVSHEIRTPLTNIKGYTETLINALEDENFFDRDLLTNFLNIVNDETDRMTLIVSDLLELSRFDNKQLELNKKPCDLVALIENNTQGHKITAEKQNKTVSFHSSLENAPAEIDPERINQVLNNIISNSLRYSNEGAKIEIELYPGRDNYLIYVSDNGIGIPKEDLRMIFERFFRVDKARSRELGGTGLGLSIAKEIMEAHGGRINASSELGIGTVMLLRLPIIPADSDTDTDKKANPEGGIKAREEAKPEESEKIKLWKTELSEDLDNREKNLQEDENKNQRENFEKTEKPAEEIHKKIFIEDEEISEEELLAAEEEWEEL